MTTAFPKALAIVATALAAILAPPARIAPTAWARANLIVADGSVLPTSIGVNSQLPVMAIATKIAHGLRADWSKYAGRAA